MATLAVAGNTDALHHNGGWIPKDGQKRLPLGSSPFRSTIVLVTRAGDPKNIKRWDDLIRPDVKVITPNPKNSGGARWNDLAAWKFAKRNYGSDAKVRWQGAGSQDALRRWRHVRPDPHDEARRSALT